MGNNETIEVEMSRMKDGHKFDLFTAAVLSSANDRYGFIAIQIHNIIMS